MANLDSQYPEELRQQAFVDHQNGTLVALAGPGTGKTHSLILRIQELTENRHIEGSNICYLTFIREIVHAFKDDLQLKYPGEITPQNISASTLHSLACRLIRNRGHRIQLNGYLCFLNLSDDRDRTVKIAASDIRWMLPQGTNIQSVNTMRPHLRVIKGEWQNGGSINGLVDNDALVGQTYNAYSRTFGLLDWDEVIPLATYIYSDEDDRPTWIKNFQHLLIDEYQDFNIAEQSFLRLISESASSCAVVGDDDQSIYSSRGASPSGIRELIQDSKVDNISLVQCRRCCQQIVESVNKFLSFMHSSPRHLKAVKSGGVVEKIPFKSAVAEVDSLTDYINRILGQINENSLPDEGVVCLFPSHRVLSQYKTEFERRGLKCKCRDTTDLFDEKWWLRIMGKLAFQRNQPFLERLLLDKFPAFKDRHKKEVISAMLNENTSINSVLSSIGSRRTWREPALTAISEYSTFLQALTSGDSTQIASCVDSVLPGGRQCNPYHIDDFLANANETIIEESLDILINRIFRDNDVESNEVRFEPAVELLTLHSSKGLTRRYVILPGLEQCWLPGDYVGNALEERKRLFLVGITRATESLLITYPRTRARGDTLNYNISGRGELSEFAKIL